MYSYKHFYTEKLIAIGIPLLILFTTLGTYFYSYTYMAIGLGHISMAFLYQFKSLFRDNSYLRILSYILFLVFLSYIMYRLIVWNYIFMAFITGIYFVAHTLIDEVKINKIYNLKETFTYIHIFPVAFLYLSIYLYMSSIAYVDYMYSWVLTAMFITSIIFLISSFILYIISFKNNALFFKIVYVIIALSSPLLVQLAPLELLGIYVVYHYMSWYVFYYFKVKDKEAKKRTYITEVIIINIIVFSSLIIIFHYTAGLEGYNIFSLYLPAFVASSLVHFISSNVFFLFKKEQLFSFG